VPGVGWGQLENCGWQISSCQAFTFRIQAAISSVTSCTEETANQGNLANQKNYVGVLISLWLFYVPICSTTKLILLGWVKEVRIMKS
jgi:hypothetical protein